MFSNLCQLLTATTHTTADPIKMNLSSLYMSFLYHYLLAVMKDALFGANAALGASQIWFPLATLDVDVHVEFPTEHGHLGLRQQAH